MKWLADTKTVQTVTQAVITGRLDANDYFQMRELVREHQIAQGGVSVMLDLRQAVLQIGTLDVFAIASSHHDVYPHGMPYAIIVGPETMPASDVRFLENVKINRGALAKIFTDDQAALEWLATCVS